MSYIPTPAIPDKAAFSEGTQLVLPVGGEWNDASATLAAGECAALRITEKRAAHVNLRNETGTEMGTAANPLQVSVANFPASVTSVSVSNLPATQPVSGAVSVSNFPGTQPISGTISDATLAAIISGGKAQVQDATAEASLGTIVGAIASGKMQVSDVALDALIVSGALAVKDATLETAISAGKLSSQQYALGNNDVAVPLRVPVPSNTMFANLTVGGSSSPSVVFTAPAGQYFLLFALCLTAVNNPTSNSFIQVCEENSAGTNLANIWMELVPSGYIRVSNAAGFLYRSLGTGNRLVVASNAGGAFNAFFNYTILTTSLNP